LDRLAAATSDLLGTIADKVSRTGGLNVEGVLFYLSYDMEKRFAYDMNNILKRNTSTEDFNTWMTFYEKAIPYARHSARWMTSNAYVRIEMNNFVDIPSTDCGSIGMFFPDIIYDKPEMDFNQAIKQFQWNDVIRWEQYGW
jgi:hypothetical protein